MISKKSWPQFFFAIHAGMRLFTSVDYFMVFEYSFAILACMISKKFDKENFFAILAGMRLFTRLSQEMEVKNLSVRYLISVGIIVQFPDFRFGSHMNSSLPRSLLSTKLLPQQEHFYGFLKAGSLFGFINTIIILCALFIFVGVDHLTISTFVLEHLIL